MEPFRNHGPQISNHFPCLFQKSLQPCLGIISISTSFEIYLNRTKVSNFNSFFQNINEKSKNALPFVSLSIVLTRHIKDVLCTNIYLMLHFLGTEMKRPELLLLMLLMMPDSILELINVTFLPHDLWQGWVRRA